MSLLSALRSLARQVTPIALDLYDREDQASMLPLVAQIVPNPGKELKGDLEWLAVFPEMRLWLDERTSQKAFTGAIPWKGEAYEITMQYDKRDAERASALVNVSQLGEKISLAFVRGKVLLAMKPLRENLLAYDGQNFFDTDHTHPTGGVYSNIVPMARTDAASPTLGEAREELKKARRLLQRNRIIRNGLAKAIEVENSLIVFTKSDAVFQAYDDLLNEDRIGGDPNRWRGKFMLIQDYAPAAGTENTVDFIWSEPNGPRPSVFVPTREPSGLEFNEAQVFTHNLIDLGMDAEYAVSPAFPQVAVRVQ